MTVNEAVVEKFRQSSEAELFDPRRHARGWSSAWSVRCGALEMAKFRRLMPNRNFMIASSLDRYGRFRWNPFVASIEGMGPALTPAPGLAAVRDRIDEELR
jgi:hypothetical protein